MQILNYIKFTINAIIKANKPRDDTPTRSLRGNQSIVSLRWILENTCDPAEENKNNSRNDTNNSAI